MWNLIPKKLMPPTRLVRYCCQELKENNANGRYIATGVRWDKAQTKNMWDEFERIGKCKKTDRKIQYSNA